MVKPTILMIHGMWAQNWVWDNYIPFFEARGFECLAPNLRHHNSLPNEKPHPDLGKTIILDYVDDLEAIIKKLKAPPILIAHSMGGLLAQKLMAKGIISKAVLLAPAPGNCNQS